MLKIIKICKRINVSMNEKQSKNIQKSGQNNSIRNTKPISNNTKNKGSGVSKKDTKNSKNLSDNTTSQYQQNQLKKSTKSKDVSNQLEDKNSTKNSDNGSENNKDDFNLKISQLQRVKIGLIWAVCVLFVLTIIGSILSSIFITKYVNVTKNNSQTFLKEINLEVGINKSSSKAVSLIKNIIEGVEYPQVVKLHIDKVINPLVLRVKADMINGDGNNLSLDIETNDLWYKGDDEYYYYKQLIKEKIDIVLTQSITIPIGIQKDMKTNNKHILVITSESVDYASNYAQGYWLSPNTWLTE